MSDVAVRPQGLKPTSSWILFGTAEAVPFPTDPGTKSRALHAPLTRAGSIVATDDFRDGCGYTATIIA
jgi:hypothetical protein